MPAVGVPSGESGPVAGFEGIPALELSPRAIRGGLLPEDVEVFDRQFRSAMALATESLDLTGLLGLLGHWRLVAASSADPEAHRAMSATAERLNAGEDVVTVPWSQARTRLGL